MKPVHRHVFCFNPQTNGGESLTIITDFIPNGDPGIIYTSQEISLGSYSNSASFNLSGASLTPENLRDLANQLESAQIEAKSKL